jgi:hypothetical protein
MRLDKEARRQARCLRSRVFAGLVCCTLGAGLCIMAVAGLTGSAVRADDRICCCVNWEVTGFPADCTDPCADPPTCSGAIEPKPWDNATCWESTQQDTCTLETVSIGVPSVRCEPDADGCIAPAMKCKWKDHGTTMQQVTRCRAGSAECNGSQTTSCGP